MTTSAAFSPDGRVSVAYRAGPGPGNRSTRDGSFSLNGVLPGEYTVVVTGNEDFYLQSIRLGAQDVLTNGLRVEGPVQGELDIVLGTRGGIIEGTVLDARQEPPANIMVVAVPDAARRGRSDVYKTSTTDAAGRFELRGLAPGSYDVFAWEHVEAGAWQDSDFIDANANVGRAVYLNEGARTSVDLSLIASDR
jgi:hypothetical protein